MGIRVTQVPRVILLSTTLHIFRLSCMKLTTIPIQFRQVLPKRLVRKLRLLENSHFKFLFLNFLFFKFVLDFFKGLVSNAQANPNIEKHQIPGNGAKNLIGRI